MRVLDRAREQSPTWLVWVALWIVYLVWGSTYLAIRVVVETMPPLLSGGARFLLAGAIMFAVLAARRGVAAFRVRLAEVIASTAVGTALLLGGNGLVTVAEQHVTSALAALIVASVPLWVVLLRFLSSERVSPGTLAGVAVGFVGVALLVAPGGGSAGSVGYSLLIVVASMSWATGSFFSKKLPLPADPFVSTTVQMLCGGAVMTLVALVRGEASGLDVTQFSGASLAGFAYLVVAGSLLAFTAYVWLLQHAPISKVATYAYVNPVIAIFLGWLILSEQITTVIVIGASLIVASVATIVRIESRPEKATEIEEPPAPGAPGVGTLREPEYGLVRSPD
jgi:drug/metabolite transporter (DMT)-like permease